MLICLRFYRDGSLDGMGGSGVLQRETGTMEGIGDVEKRNGGSGIDRIHSPKETIAIGAF